MCRLECVMTSAAEKILEEALTLSEQERRRLTRALLDSLPRESSEDVEAAWRNEVMSRIEQVERGDVELEPWSEV